MKTILTTVLLSIAALSVNAATMTWNIANIKQPSDSTLAASDGWLALLFTVSDSITVDSVTEAFSSGNFDFVSDATQSATTSSGKVSVKGIGDYAASSSTTVFAVVLDAATGAEAENFLITPAQTKTVAASGANFTTTFNVGTASWTAIDVPTPPDPVPEPATGALALAGVALLFKRRRA